LPQLVGLARARRLLITGEPIDAVEAHAMGLIAYLVEDDELAAEAAALAARMAALDPAAVRANRALLRQDEPSSIDQALARERQSNHERVATPEFAESISRFRK
jgi:enoyl-CoA hydratase/carnithine racemase